LNYFRAHVNNLTKHAIYTGNDIIENIHLLKLLQVKGIIPDDEFRQSLGRLYKKYCGVKKKLWRYRKKKIQSAFEKSYPGRGFKRFMFGFNIYWLRKNFF